MNKVLDKPYKQDEFFKKWLVGLSDRTKENYTDEIHDWIIFVDMTPTQQIKKRMHDLTTEDITERTFFEDKFRSYKEYLEKRGNSLNGEPLKPSAVTTLLTPVASFFSRNGLPLALKRGDWESNQVQKIAQNTRTTKEDIKSMYSHGDTRDRSLLLVLSQSGFSETDVSCFRIEEMKGLYTLPETEHYFIEKPREKTNEVQATCISYEAMHDIKAMLQERGNPTTGYLFVSTTKGKGDKLEVRSINEAMKTLAERAFNPEKAKEFQTKSLRSFYNSALLRASVQPQEVKDLMFGHGRKGARGHYDYDEQTIKENYTKVFEYLSINGLQTRTDIAKLKEEFTVTKIQLADTIAKQEKKNQDLEGEVEKLNKMLHPFIDNIDEISEFLQDRREEKEAKARVERDKQEQEEKDRAKKELGI